MQNPFEGSDVSVCINEPLSRHTPLRVGGVAKRWAWVYSQDALRSLIQHLNRAKEKWMVSWPFQDMLFRDGGYDGTVIRLAGDFENIKYQDQTIKMG